jgi:hypothetical protein
MPFAPSGNNRNRRRRRRRTEGEEEEEEEIMHDTFSLIYLNNFDCKTPFLLQLLCNNYQVPNTPNY